MFQEADLIFPLPFSKDELLPLSSIEEIFRWQNTNEDFEIEFVNFKNKYPLNESLFEEITRAFIVMFPVYMAFINLSKGIDANFQYYLTKLQKWFYNEMLENDENSIETHVGVSILSKNDLNNAITKSIRVMPGLRWQVFQRDKWKCVACGKTADDDVILHVDHIIPKSKGGLNQLENFQTLCHICNVGKSNKDDTNIKLTR